MIFFGMSRFLEDYFSDIDIKLEKWHVHVQKNVENIKVNICTLDGHNYTSS